MNTSGSVRACFTVHRISSAAESLGSDSSKQLADDARELRIVDPLQIAGYALAVGAQFLRLLAARALGVLRLDLEFEQQPGGIATYLFVLGTQQYAQNLRRLGAGLA